MGAAQRRGSRCFLPFASAGGRDVGEERLHLGHVLAEVLQERIEVVQHRPEVFEHGDRQFERLLHVRQSCLGGLRQRPERRQEAVELRRERLRRLEQRGQLALGRLEFFEVRVGDRGETVGFLERHRRVALERRQRLEGFGEGLAGFGGGVEGALAVDDRAFELVVAARERVEDDTRVVHERFHRPFLLVEQRHELVGVFDERFELREGRR